MARVDYYGIAESIKSILDVQVPGLGVFIEEPKPAGADQNPSATIQIRRRSAPDALQRLTAGTELVVEVEAVILVEAFSPEHIRQAIELRDDYIGEIETALMGAPTLNGGAEISFLDGGELETGRDAQGYYAVGEVRLRLRKLATI